MPNRPRRGLTLVQKGLALIVVPFLFNSLWLFMLFGVLDKTNRLAELERNQSIFIEHLNTVMDASYQSRESLLGYITTRKKSYLDHADIWLKRTSTALAELTGLPRLSHDQRALAAQLGETLDGQLGQIRELMKNFDGQSSAGLMEDFEAVKESLGTVLGADPDMRQHVMEQRADLDRARLESQKNAGSTSTLVLAGLGGNLLITGLLVLLLNRELSSRLRMLLENAQRLPRRQQLNSPLEGGDELASLDDSLHQASLELQRAADFRASLMQMVAHDLRSPLFSCTIALDLIARSESDKLSPKGQSHLTAMQRNLDRLIALTNDILLIEQYENDQLALDLGPENIREVIDQAFLAVGALADARTVRLENLAAQEYVSIDRNRIIQVVVNFLSNAIKFSPADSAVEVSTTMEKKGLKVSVMDHGCGISAADKARLFQKFFQTKDGKEAGGAGLGLTICKSIIRAHGGDVGVAGQEGKGSIFWFTIPMESEPVDDL